MQLFIYVIKCLSSHLQIYSFSSYAPFAVLTEVPVFHNPRRRLSPPFAMSRICESIEPRDSSDTESFHSTSEALEEPTVAYFKTFKTKEQHQQAEIPSSQISSDRTFHKDCAEQDATSRATLPEKVEFSEEQPLEKLHRTSIESLEGSRRSKSSTGPKAPIPRRRSSVPVRRRRPDLISFHRQSCRLFQSLEGTLALSSPERTKESSHLQSRQGSLPDTQPSSQSIIRTENGFAYLASTKPVPQFGSVTRTSTRNSSIATSTHVPDSDDSYPPPTTTNTTSSSNSSFASASTAILESQGKHYQCHHLPTPPTSVTAFPPTPNSAISWTSTKTRRYEYAKIDRSNSGLRGLWKRVTPRWCHGKCARTGFFSGGGKDFPSGGGGGRCNDAGSVRRYRMPLNDDDDDDGEDDDDDNDSQDDEDDENHQIASEAERKKKKQQKENAESRRVKYPRCRLKWPLPWRSLLFIQR